MLWHSMTFGELYSLIAKQRQVIRAMAWLLILCIILIGASTLGAIKRDRTIADLEALRAANNMVINDLAARIAELEAMDAMPVTALVSRGVDRTAVITAYTWTGDKTASGSWPKEGRTCAGPTWVPFGTKVFIDGVGYRIVEDRTAERFDGRYDIYMDKKSDCIQWGIQQRTVR